MNLKVGDTVLLVPRPNQRFAKAIETQVVRVGRKYAYVEGPFNSEIAFDMETWREKGSIGSAARTIRTPELHARVQRRHIAEQRLHELGIKPRESSRFAYSVEALESVIEILEHDA